VQAGITDVHHTLTYDREKAGRQLLAIGVITLALRGY
jgi:hypothetical protein